MKTSTKYFGKVRTEFPKESWNSIEWPVGKEVVFSHDEYGVGYKLECVGHGTTLQLDWKDVDFYKKAVTRTETVTKEYKL